MVSVSCSIREYVIILFLVSFMCILWSLSVSQRTSLTITPKAATRNPNLLRPTLVSCPAENCEDANSSCWTFTGSCDTTTAISIPHECVFTDKIASVVVTAFISVRTDRESEVWIEWMKKYAEIPANVFAWLPRERPDIVRLFHERRQKYAENFKTCVVPTAAAQLPYGYAIKSVREKFERGMELPAGWNREAPEVTIPAYVPLQFSKIPFMHATSSLVEANTYIWTDIGLARHVTNFGNLAWPNAASIVNMSHDSLYLTSWSGYGDATEAWNSFCDGLPTSFTENRNLLSGTVILAGRYALEQFLPIWTFVLESMIKHDAPWNNEQPVFSMIGCFHPSLVGVIDAQTTQRLWDTLRGHLPECKRASSSLMPMTSLSDVFS